MPAGSGGIIFKPSGTTERLRITSTGSVGIGTSSPATKLEVSGDISATQTSGNSVGFGSGGFSYDGVTVTDYGITYTQPGAEYNTVVSGFTNLKFTTNRTEAMRITSAGSVGIGTTNPLRTLQVNNTGADFAAAANFVDNGAASSWARIDLTHQLGGGPLAIFQNQAGQTGMQNTSTSANANLFFVAGASGNPSEIIFSSTPSTEEVRIDSNGNLIIGGTVAGASSQGNLVLFNGTAPTGNVTNGITLYAEDVSSSSELKVRDEAGNVTTLSPHNFDLIPEGPSEDMAWSYYSERDGQRINVDMLKAIRLLEQLTGEKLVHMA
jgi:hypothetical protein